MQHTEHLATRPLSNAEQAMARAAAAHSGNAGACALDPADMRGWGRFFYLFLLFAVLSVGVIANALSAGPQRELKPFPGVTLQQPMRGNEAIKGLGTKLPAVAAWYGMSTSDFTKMLRQDRMAWLDGQGRLFFVDDYPETPEQGTTVGDAGSTSITVPTTLDQTFRLHSRPGANRVIYLDFDGHVATNTAWNSSYGMSTIDAKAFDLDGNPTSFTDAELQRIQYIWKRVAEDYAPFDVDVTTEEPPADLIARSSSTDQLFGTRVVITADWTDLTASPCGCGGFAYVGAFDDTTENYKPAWVFYNKLGSGNEKYVAEAISHEAGHNLGLSHDGYNDGTTNVGYYSGHGSGATGWAPIMGVGYYRELTQWSKGEYQYATQTQDDLQVIQNFGGTLRVDDHGNAFASATPLGLTYLSNSVVAEGGGVISTRADVDVFSFYAEAGAVTLNVTPGQRGANLDIVASLYDGFGNLVATSNPVDRLDASILTSLPAAGTYYLVIDGVGKGDASTGYTDYASLGEYTISGSLPASGGGNLPPAAVASVSSTSGVAPLTVNFSSTGSSDPEGATLSYVWNFGDGTANSSEANPSHTYTEAGTYTATLTVTDAAGLTDSKQLTITVTAPPQALPTIHVDNIVMAVTIKRSGNRATASVTVKDAAGKPVSGVTVSGLWSGIVGGTASGTSNAKGIANINSPFTKSTGTYTFTVTGMQVSGYTYDAAQNIETTDSITK